MIAPAAGTGWLLRLICLLLPFTLYTRLVQNWVLGEALCYILPVISVITLINRTSLIKTMLRTFPPICVC